MNRPTRDIVVVGGSAGSVPAVLTLLGVLPADFPAAVVVALHRGPAISEADGLAKDFASHSRLPVHPASDEQLLEPGQVYIGPGDYHLVLQNGLIRLEDSPKEQRFRPCIDVLFKSAAAAFGRRVVGVLLSGKFGNDGAAGLWQINHRGGVSMVQDPSEAQSPGLPQGVLDTVAVDYVLPVVEIAATLRALASREPGVGPRVARILIVEDESLVAANLQQSLSDLGYDVIDWVPSGEAALALAEREHPDLVLMDVHLAGRLSGIETARRIWQTLQVPVVYCTALADLDTLKAVQATENYGYVVKPFQTAGVRAAIELALGRRERERR